MSIKVLLLLHAIPLLPQQFFSLIFKVSIILQVYYSFNFILSGAVEYI